MTIPTRTAVATAILVVSVAVAGCAGPDEPPEGVEANETTFTENERGAHPDSPGNDTQNRTATGNAAANETITDNGTQDQTATGNATGNSAGTETNTADANATNMKLVGQRT